MIELSPAAQAVLDAANGAQCYGPDDCLNESRWIVAAALRAAADQITPEDYSCYTGHLEHDFAMEARNESVREAILAIAAELEGAE
jgi:hypothetical protein